MLKITHIKLVLQKQDLGCEPWAMRGVPHTCFIPSLSHRAQTPDFRQKIANRGVPQKGFLPYYT